MKIARVVLGCVALIVAGCGGGSSTTTSSDSSSSKPAATSAPASAGSASSAAKASIKSFTFHPGSITVSAGGKVTWTNQDSANHNVTFSDKSIKNIPNLRQGQSGDITFAKAGTYSYVCTYHPGMKGTVVVK